MAWGELKTICKTFLLTNAIVIPVGLTVTDEVGLPYLVKGVSMRVRKQKMQMEVV